MNYQTNKNIKSKMRTFEKWENHSSLIIYENSYLKIVVTVTTLNTFQIPSKSFISHYLDWISFQLFAFEFNAHLNRFHEYVD